MVTNQRVNCIDTLRGVALLVLFFSHVCYFLIHKYPSQPGVNFPFLFRLISFFALPAFIFLSGVSVFFYKIKNSLKHSQLGAYLPNKRCVFNSTGC